MAHTMIALVSDQRMQNIIPIFQDGANYEELILVISKERGTKKPHPRYQKVAGDLDSILSPRLKVTLSDDFVDPFNIEAAAVSINSILTKYDKNNVIVNISGGTKPMAIGALRATHNMGADCIYTNTEDGEILWLSPDGSIKKEPMQVAGFDVSLYMRAYGEEITESNRVDDLNEVHREWSRIIGDNHTIIYTNIIMKITSAIKDAQKKGKSHPITCNVNPTRKQREIIELLDQKGLWLWHHDLDEIIIMDKTSSDFLNGIWVEAYVGMRMLQSDYFNDVLLNVKLKGWEGEIDVAAVSNGKLVLIECKSNVQQSQQLSKLESLCRRLGGPYAQAYYARASEAYAERIKTQCRKYNIDGEFFGRELQSIGEKIGENIRKIS